MLRSGGWPVGAIASRFRLPGPWHIGLALPLALLWMLCFASVAPVRAEAPPFQRGINIASYLHVVWFPPGTQRGQGAYWYAPDNATIDADLRRVRRMGFDFVRIVVDAAVLQPLAGAERAAGLATVARVLERVPPAGLGLVVALSFPPGAGGPEARVTGSQVLAEDGATAAAFLDLLDEVVRLVGALPAARLALEPLAEPPVCAREAPRWYALQEQALARVRAAGFEGWNVVSPACFGTLGALLAFDPRPLLQGRSLLTFHFYEPHAFTHQGHSGFAVHTPYLDGLPFPYDPPRVEAAMRSARDRLAADPALSEEERQRRWLALRTDLDIYRTGATDALAIRARFEAVAVYVRALGIPGPRVFLGEFGASVGRPAMRRGAEPADRARYVAAVREAAEAAGFAWAFWQLWGGFGLAATGAERCIESLVLEALRANPECRAAD